MTSPWRSLLPVTIATALVLAALLALGTWQVKRLAWKEGLIAAATERVARPPAELPAPAGWSALDSAGYEFTRVRLTGHFAGPREFHVYTTLTRPKGPVGGQGYWVMAPFEQADGTIVFVNRGFVPLEKKDPATRPEGIPAGKATIEGLMRGPEPRDRFTAEDDAARNIWLRRDPARFAAALGLDAA
ncbi:MAG: SURF1 family cytochrome oxidase biogenesis protein, partial [Hyphomicrobiales bacterium]